MPDFLLCIKNDHHAGLIGLAALVCTVGVYATFAIATHTLRSTGRARRVWGLTSVTASACTAWATHFVALLAYRPRLPAAFEPVLTAASLLIAIVVIGTGVSLVVAAHGRVRRFAAGLIIGSGVAALHYVGQAAYAVHGHVSWDRTLVVVSVAASLPIYGVAILAAASRKRRRRYAAAPLLLFGIAMLHFGGMAAMTIRYDPAIALPANAVSPLTITPLVAGICMGLVTLAVLGLRFDLAAKARVRRDRDHLSKLSDVAFEGLLICNGDAIATANASIERLSGFGRRALSDTFVSTLLPGLDLHSLPQHEEREAELIAADGQPVPVRVLRSEMALGGRMQTVIAVRDQRERLRTEARIRSLAFSDPLTGLPNRTRFYDQLALHAASRRDADQSFAVLMIDLDRFKAVNDTMGHAAGDLVLRKAADRLSAIVREGDMIGRLGGDEFAVVQSGSATPDAAATLAQRIVDGMRGKPFTVDGQAVYIGASVGVAIAHRQGEDPAELLRAADVALYAAKAAGKGVFKLYDPLLDARMQERRTLEAGLRRALANGEFEVHYQPLVDAVLGHVTSAEALVRWRDPERGLIPPVEFIGLAEETGLILPLGEWVLRTACAEAATWPDGIGVAVNLSPVQFRDDGLAAMVRSALDAAELPAGRLELEVTEGVLLMDEVRTLAILTELRAAGVRLSMDDFGTGYSSLSYLRRFPFNKIKIDQSFVQQLPGSAESAAIVRAIITMGKCLGMSTTVEGVETADQYDFSVAEGCDHVQGYLVSRPLTATRFAAFLAAEDSGRDGEMAPRARQRSTA